MGFVLQGGLKKEGMLHPSQKRGTKLREEGGGCGGHSKIVGAKGGEGGGLANASPLWGDFGL